MTEDCRVIHGDCLAVLPTLADVSIVVTDPPYGIGFVKGAGGRAVAGTRRPPRRHHDPILGDDKPFDPSPWLRWPCVMFGANHFCDRLPPGGTFHAWDKRAGSTLDDSFSDVEFIWTSWREKSRIISYLWKGVLQDGEKGLPRYHVSQKPVAVMARLIEWFTGPDDVILDPYAGSGSTGVACLKAGRRCILVEKDARYIPVIERRLAAAATPLFDSPPS